jgi:hypothetical protein
VNYVQDMQQDGPSARDLALARFLRTFAAAALDLAEEMESASPGHQGWRTIESANLGSLQQQVAGAPGMYREQGASPKEITQHLRRVDEPNIRTALAAMRKRGVAELVPGAAPQRWRLRAPYRLVPTTGGPPARLDGPEDLNDLPANGPVGPQAAEEGSKGDCR